MCTSAKGTPSVSGAAADDQSATSNTSAGLLHDFMVGVGVLLIVCVLVTVVIHLFVPGIS